MSSEHDFDFLHGDWTVHHRKLNTRLAGANDWAEFGGTSSTRPILAGHGNVEDNYIDDPGGGYRAAAVRSFDAGSGLWRIWWLDQRSPATLGPFVEGRFDGNRGEFFADDEWNGQAIVVRFVWLKNAGEGPLWEQAFSLDRCVTWEVNWSMQFIRDKG